jgi:hypothetical protein
MAEARAMTEARAKAANNTIEPGSPNARGIISRTERVNVMKPTRANAPLEPTPITKTENMNIDEWWETAKEGRSRSHGVTSEKNAIKLQNERKTSKNQAVTNSNANVKIKTQAIANAKVIENAKAKAKAIENAKAYRSQTSPPPPPPIKKPNASHTGGRRKTRRIRKTRRSCRK